MKLKITEIKFSIIHLKERNKRYTATRIAYIRKSGIIGGERIGCAVLVLAIVELSPPKHTTTRETARVGVGGNV